MEKLYFKRKIYEDVKKHMESNDVTIITGMRRTGKTTLVQHLLSDIDSKNKIFLDLEKISNRDLFSDKNYDNVILNLEQQGLNKDERMYIAIDEIQTLPNISSVVKYLNDHYNIKFILTGSSSYYLKNLFTESLSGRKKLFELYPLDFGEFLTFKNVPHKSISSITDIKNFNTHGQDSKHEFDAHEYERLKAYYEEYIEFGGFPKVVLANSREEKRQILEDIISSYINIDIKSIADFKDANAISNLVKMLAARTGSKLDYSKIGRLIGLSRQTVQNYISLFEKTYLISLVSVHSNNKDREIVKAQKIYFQDNGLLSALAQVDSGSKFENALYNQLKHLGEVKYFSLKDGREIDFILEYEANSKVDSESLLVSSQKIALEAKETADEGDLATLHAISIKADVKKYSVITRHKPLKFKDCVWGGNIL